MKRDPLSRRINSAKPLEQRIADADARGNYWLAEGNAAQETGQQKKADECYRKGQFWLDRLNALQNRR